nr:hypothetical protein [Tanacetum cinerariifolium]
MRDEKKRLDHLKQDQTMLVIKRFSERKKIFKERKKTEKFIQRVFDGAFEGVGDEEVVIRECVVRFSSSFMISTKSYFGGMMAQSPSREVRRMQERNSSERRKDLVNAQNFKEIVWLEFLMISAEAYNSNKNLG